MWSYVFTCGFAHLLYGNGQDIDVQENETKHFSKWIAFIKNRKNEKYNNLGVKVYDKE